MLTDLALLLLGIVLIAGGICGKEFTIGLSGKMRASPWYGRTWLIGCGFLVGIPAAIALARVFSSVRSGARTAGR